MAGQYAAMYLHPWDLVDEGVEHVLGTLRGIGINVVNIATSYHSGRYLLPHNPKRAMYFAEEGVIYFTPHMHFYTKTRLKPQRSRIFKDADVLQLLSQRADSYGMKISGWTIALHNSAFGQRYPETTIANPMGDRDLNNLCPNNPEARNYLMGLVSDLTSNYDLSSITLESASFPWGAYHGDHHEMFGVLLEPIVNELLSSCFCKYCETKAKEWNIGLSAIREMAKKMISTSLNSPVSATVSEEERLKNYHSLSVGLPQMLDLLRFKMLTTQEVIEQARESIRFANRRAKLNVMVQGVFPHEVGVVSKSSEGVSLSEIAKAADAVTLVTFAREPQTVLYHVRWSKFEVGATPLIATIRPNYPMAYTPSALLAQIEGVFSGGADGIAFHSYGMTPTSQFKWIKEGLRKQKSSSRRGYSRN